MIIAIVGSQSLSIEEYADAEHIVSVVVDNHDRFLGSWPLFISGGAAGVDSIAEKMVIERLGKHRFEAILPKVRRWAEPGGFRDRNIAIAKRCDRLFLIRSKSSRTYGSGWTADYAELLGKRVTRFAVPLEKG